MSRNLLFDESTAWVTRVVQYTFAMIAARSPNLLLTRQVISWNQHVTTLTIYEYIYKQFEFEHHPRIQSHWRQQRLTRSKVRLSSSYTSLILQNDAPAWLEPPSPDKIVCTSLALQNILSTRLSRETRNFWSKSWDKRHSLQILCVVYNKL